MDKETALDILELDSSATEEDIKRQYRELASQHHPDADGEDEKMIELNAAKATALESISNELIPKDTLEGAIRHSSKQEQRRIESEKTVEKIIERGTSKYRRYRQRALILGGVFLSLTLFFRFSGPLPTSLSLLSPYLALTILPIGIFAYMFHMSMKNIELMVNEADEALSDKMEFIQLLEDIGLSYQDDPVFTERELEREVQKWSRYNKHRHSPFSAIFKEFKPVNLLGSKLNLRSIAHHVGSSEFSRLIVKKGLEKELLSEIETIDGDNWMVKYEFNTPSKSSQDRDS